MTRAQLNAMIAEAIAPRPSLIAAMSPRRALIAQMTAATDGSFDLPVVAVVAVAGAAWADLGVMASIAEGVRAIARDADAEVLTYWKESPTIHGVRYISRGRHRFAWVRLGVADLAGYPESEKRPVVLRDATQLPEVAWEK